MLFNSNHTEASNKEVFSMLASSWRSLNVDEKMVQLSFLFIDDSEPKSMKLLFYFIFYVLEICPSGKR